MRALVGLGLGLAVGSFGCQVLPQREVLCSDTERCEGQGGSGGPKITAPFVLGQPDDRSNFYPSGLNNPTAVALSPDGKLIVADRGHDRVLIWNSVPTQNQQPASVVLGQAELSIGPRTGAPNNGRSDLPDVYRLAVDGTQLIAASESRNFLAIFRPIPTANNLAYLFASDGGAGVSASTFSGASPGLAAGRMYVADRANSRVMLWNPAPNTGGSNSDAVLGQINAQGGTANAGGLGQGSLNLPDGSPSSDGTKLLVTDTANHRALLWTTLPNMKMDNPALVFGQANFTSNSANRGGLVDLGSMSSPMASALSASRMAVVDRGNHRVLLWNQHPTASGQAADIVLGQASVNGTQANGGGAVSGGGLDSPSAVATDGTRVVVADSGNHRVLIWNTWPTSNGAVASVVLGQPSLTSATPRGLYAKQTLFASPSGVARLGGRLVVTDMDAHRVLIFSGLPLDGTAQASVVIGQPSFDSSAPNNGGLSAVTLSSPRSAASDGTALAVADTGNNRVLIFRSPPSANQAAADLVLGQSSMTAGMANSGGASGGLRAPASVGMAGGKLYVADTGNHRVLIWNSLPTQNRQAPDVVLGQSNFNTTSANRGQGAAQANSLRSPGAVYTDGTSLFVSDVGNNRVLVWKTTSPMTGQAADLVIGQSNLTGSNSPVGASATVVSVPQGIAVYNGQLFVADAAFHRVLRFAAIPTQNAAVAVEAIGQPSLTAGSANNGGISSARVNTPIEVLATEAGLYIADSGNSRVLALPPQ